LFKPSAAKSAPWLHFASVAPMLTLDLDRRGIAFEFHDKNVGAVRWRPGPRKIGEKNASVLRKGRYFPFLCFRI